MVENRMYPRHISARLQDALADTRVVALNGPRQSGKTTTVRQFITPQRRYVTLDDSAQLAATRADPIGFIRDLEFAIIDEVQRALAPDLPRSGIPGPDPAAGRSPRRQ